MTNTVLHGRSIVGGIVEGEAVVVTRPLNFGAAFYPATLSDAPKVVVMDPTNELYGMEVTGKILVYPTQHGSTGITGSFMKMVQKDVAPAALICNEIDPMMAASVILADKILERRLPTVDSLDRDPTIIIRTGDFVRVDGDAGIVEVVPSD